MTKLQKPKVFIVDDSSTSRTIIRNILDIIDIEILEFSSPEEAKSSMSIEKPDLVIVDYELAEYNADQFMIKMSELLLLKDTSFYLISGKNLGQDQIFGIYTLGVEKYFEKPIKENEFLIAVKENLGI